MTSPADACESSTLPGARLPRRAGGSAASDVDDTTPALVVVSAHAGVAHLVERAVRRSADVGAVRVVEAHGSAGIADLPSDAVVVHCVDDAAQIRRADLRSRFGSVGLVTVSTDRSEQVALDCLAGGADEHLALAHLDPPTLTRALARARTRATRRRTETSPRHDAHAEQERIRAIVEMSADVTMFFAEDGTIAWVSPASARVLGIDPQLLEGLNGWELVHPDDRERVVAELMAVTGEEQLSSTFRVLDGLGGVRWFEETVVDRRWHPDIGYVVATLRDVTERRAAEELARFHSRVLSTIGEAVAATDEHGRITYLNPAAERLYGWTTEEARGLNGGRISVGEPGVDGAEILDRQIRSGAAWAGGMWLKRRDGSRFYGHVTNTPLLDDEGCCRGLIGVTTDLTDQLELVRCAEEDRLRLAEAQRSAQLGSFELDARSRRVTFSDELRRLLGLAPDDEVDADTYRRSVHPDDLDAVDDATRRAMSRSQASLEIEHRVVRPDGSIRWVLARSRWDTSDPHLLRGTVLDITERHHAEERLAHGVVHDPLTGLPNRLGVTRRVEAALDEQRRGGPAVAVAFCDLDRFKVINDGLGHGTGDAVLLEVARRLQAALPPSCSVGRFGGDEFVLICPDAPSDAVALDTMNEILERLREPILVDDREFVVGASVGVAVSRPSDDPDTLLQAADTAMYAAKRAGGGTVELFDEQLRRRSTHSLEIETELRRAVQLDQLALFVQPVVEIATGRAAGFESLLRWEHPRLGMVLPSDFIPVAEDCGFIEEIGQWVLERSLQLVAGWPGDAPRGRPVDRPWIAVNLSARQLTRPGLVERVGGSIRRAGVDPQLVHLEITESVLMDRIDASLETLHELRDLGVNLSVDDFGTGYSSLSYLKRLPVQTLKIDRSFVDGLGEDSHDTSIVRAISALSDALDLDLVAEGVETDAQHSELARLGCRYAQGYLWSEPMPAELASRWWRAQAEPHSGRVRPP